MNKGNICFGIFLITIGIFIILINFGIIDWSILDAFFEIWPAILIVIGINIIFRNNTIVKTISWLLFLALLIGYSYYHRDQPGFYKRNWENGRDLKIEEKTEIKGDKLSMDVGGTKFYL